MVVIVALPVVFAPTPTFGYSDTAAFHEWLSDFRTKARHAGVSRAVVDQHLTDIQPDSRVLRKSENQAEFTTPFPEYKGYFVTHDMIERGQSLRDKHREILQQIEDRYGVPPHILVAIWGIESRYGSQASWHDPIPSMATMAFKQSRRSDYFAEELITLLSLIDRGEIPNGQLKGSWAGALGQPQFMPSSYETYAVDFDGDGKKNIWTAPADILASIAHYLSENGWETNQVWGTVIEDSDISSPGKKVVSPDSAAHSYEVGHNFEVLMTYNRSQFYALTVGLLAEEIGPLANS